MLFHNSGYTEKNASGNVASGISQTRFGYCSCLVHKVFWRFLAFQKDQYYELFAAVSFEKGQIYKLCVISYHSHRFYSRRNCLAIKVVYNYRCYATFVCCETGITQKKLIHFLRSLSPPLI